MELANIVDYDKTFELKLVHPSTDEEIGVTFWMRSIDSPQAEKVLLEHTDKQIERFAKRKLPTAAQGKRAELERTAACIARWDWGGHTFQGEEVGELTVVKAVRIFEKASWMERQAREAADTVKNFTTSSS